ncbi:MAG: DNA polymerase I [Gemmatimonadaceae bacterium]|nr:DNA polymerase I [Gemmatimonadaceae bacterium]
MPAPPPAPRLFLVDGYALIYRAFFALLSRPLTTTRGENTSAVWGVANFLQRLLANHHPEYLGWVHDAGLSFRHERYPAYKATREKLGEELQADFDRGMARISELLESMHIPVLSCDGYEADDVIGTLATQGVPQGVNVVVVSGDKDFQQLVAPGVWLLNPGRGGPASVEEQWVGIENGSERLGVPPELVVDYLALVGDSSDNVPGVKGIGDKTASELVNSYGPLDRILANVENIAKKRPREALQQYADLAILSKELVTIRRDVPVTLDLDRLRVRDPDWMRLKNLYLELEFQGLAKQAAAAAGAGRALGIGTPAAPDALSMHDTPGALPENDPALDFPPPPALTLPTVEIRYATVDTVEEMQRVVARAREVGTIAVDTETLIDPDSPQKVDPLRATLVGVTIAVAAGEAYYFPLRHRVRDGAQGDLLLDASGDRAPTDAPEDRGLVMGGDEPASVAAKPKPRKKKAAAPAEPSSIAERVLARGAQPVRNLPSLDSAEMEPLRALLEDPAVRKTAQNAKYDLLALRRAGIKLRGLDFDTMLASYVLDPGRRSHGLDVLALEFLDYRMTSFDELCGKGRNAIPYDQVPIDCARDYSCEDGDMTLRLRALFEPQLESHALTLLFREVEVPLVEVLGDMEWVGVSIDGPWFASLKTRFQAERQRVEKLIYEAAGTEFNINSNPQLREILFEKLGLPVIKRTATGPSTDASVLQELAEEGHALPSLLMEYRELSKLESTYIDALPVMVNPNTGRIHTSFTQTVASTGRLSSSDPNLQNIPIRRELGRDIRRGFIAREGWTLLSADYSQIELRLLAHLSHDPAFVQAFQSGGDIHRQTAALIFDVPLDDVTSAMRGRAKTINFATIYGQGAHALSRQLGIAHAEAKEFITRYFERFEGIRKYLDSMVDLARAQGYVQTIFGRRRYIPELRDRNFNIRAFGERTATNSPIQGSAADLIKIAMIRIHRALREQGLRSAMILQVHDELVFEAPPDELAALEALVREEMEHAAELSVPLVVDIGTGANWLETKL